MNKKTILTILIILAVIVGAIVLFRQAPAASSGLTLYYGQECPHCKVVEDYIQANNIDAKVKINKLEVFHNQANADAMGKVAQACGIQGTQLGVPLLYDGSKCYEGQDDVINYLRQYIK